MPIVDPSLCGDYLGLKKVHTGRESDLSAKDRKELAKAKPSVELALREDGSFQKQVTTGTWEADGDIIRFHPETFGGETLEQMRRRSEEMGRHFGLSFVFDPFELRRSGDALVTPDDGGPFYTEFRTNW